MSSDPVEPSLFVIFGGTGDLARRKLVPALATLAAGGDLGSCRVLGVSLETDVTDESYREWAAAALIDAGVEGDAARDFCMNSMDYQTIGKSGPEDFARLTGRLEEIERQHELPGNRSFYMAVPPRAFSSIVESLGIAGLNRSRGWTRLIIEKPFGKDLESARALNQHVHRHFEEPQIYRIDHYLGKDTVQNLMVLRFANALFESVWNRERVHSVQITVAESLGVGTRAGYYDHAGALRDMVQNHLTQLMTLVAMEAPGSFDADAIRYEKIKVLRSIGGIDCKNVIRGRYSRGVVDGQQVPGYLREPGVAPDSQTETFVALRVDVDSWRWQGVPFYLRTGKRMPVRRSTIAIRFRDVPVHLFRRMSVPLHTANVLVITLQPDEGFRLFFDVKTPGDPFGIRRIPLAVNYEEMFERLPDSYRTLLLDVLQGDQTLFVHADEVEESWRIYRHLIADPPGLYPYAAGTWGPPEAEGLTIPERELLRDLVE